MDDSSRTEPTQRIFLGQPIPTGEPDPKIAVPG